MAIAVCVCVCVWIYIKCHRRTAQSEIILMARIILRGDTANDSSSLRRFIFIFFTLGEYRYARGPTQQPALIPSHHEPDCVSFCRPRASCMNQFFKVSICAGADNEIISLRSPAGDHLRVRGPRVR